MRLSEFVVEGKSKKKASTNNYVAKHAPKSGSGTHEDKKKAEKRGKVKHKGKEIKESLFSSLEYRLIEAQLNEMDMDSFKDPKTGITYQWISHTNNDFIVAVRKTVEGVKFHKISQGEAHEIANVWKRLKQQALEKPPMPINKPTINPHIRSVEGVAESATAGATSSANISSVPNPHLTVGRSNKEYTGSPGKSGTKAPKQPKIQMQKPGTNALDSNKNIFGTGTVVKRK
jgi:hypothetical protein